MKIKIFFLSLLLISTSIRANVRALSPFEYYQKIGNNKSIDEISTFFDIYRSDFLLCKQPQIFYEAEKKLSSIQSDPQRSLKRYQYLITCDNLSSNLKQLLTVEINKITINSSPTIMISSIQSQTDMVEKQQASLDSSATPVSSVQSQTDMVEKQQASLDSSATPVSSIQSQTDMVEKRQASLDSSATPVSSVQSQTDMVEKRQASLDSSATPVSSIQSQTDMVEKRQASLSSSATPVSSIQSQTDMVEKRQASLDSSATPVSSVQSQTDMVEKQQASLDSSATPVSSVQSQTDMVEKQQASLSSSATPVSSVQSQTDMVEKQQASLNSSATPVSSISLNTFQNKKKPQTPNQKYAKTSSIPDNSNKQESKYLFSFQEKYRYKSGDKGLSRLSTLQQTADIKILNWRAGLTQQSFFNGHISSNLQYGSFYRRTQNGLIHPQKSIYNTFFPFIQYMNEAVNFYIATTPLTNSTGISPLPVIRASYKPESGMKASVFYENVEDSILSAIGLEDGYSNASFGRVMRAGINLGYTFLLKQGYFAETNIMAAAYHGHNVSSNHQFKISATFGKYFNGISLGLYTQAETYKQNQNNFTFGHGGYYSPQMAFLISPFMSYEYKKDNHYFKGDFAIGYYQDRLDRVKMYLKNTGGDTSMINSLYYDSDKHKNISGNIGFIYEYNTPNQMIIGTENRAFQSSSDYREFITKIYLKQKF